MFSLWGDTIAVTLRMLLRLTFALLLENCRIRRKQGGQWSQVHNGCPQSLAFSISPSHLVSLTGQAFYSTELPLPFSGFVKPNVFLVVADIQLPGPSLT